jgi:hypothetical protein
VRGSLQICGGDEIVPVETVADETGGVVLFGHVPSGYIHDGGTVLVFHSEFMIEPSAGVRPSAEDDRIILEPVEAAPTASPWQAASQLRRLPR